MFFLRILTFHSYQKSIIKNTEKLLEVNDINVFENWCYSITIHYLPDLMFPNNMPVYGGNLSGNFSVK